MASKLEETTQAVNSVLEVLEVLKSFPQVIDKHHVLASPLVALVQSHLRRLAGNAEFTLWLASHPHVHQEVFELMGKLFVRLEDLLYIRCHGCRADYFFDKDDDAARKNCNSCRGRTTAVAGDLVARAFGGS